MRTTLTAVVIAGSMLLTQSPAFAQSTTTSAPAEKAPAPAEKAPVRGKSEASVTKIRGTVSGVDKDAGTVTLKGPKGRTVTIEVKDKSKLDQINVGDPVVAAYMEAVAWRVVKAGSGAAPGVSTQETRVSSKPGETPAGAVGREVTATVTITAIDRKNHTVTVKGPQGGTETIKAKEPKNLEGLKVGDMVEISYSQALAVSLDKSGKGK
jgi:Cu/Ag efflux protein CusF